MQLIQIRSALFRLCTSVVFASLTSVALADGQANEPRDGFPVQYHDPAYQFVAGKITAVQVRDADEYERYTLTVLADQRDTIKSGTSISIRGPYHPMTGLSTGSDSIHVAVGQTALFFVKTTDKPGRFESLPILFVFPFGIRHEDPAIPSEDVPQLAAAFKEFNADLAAPGGVGMPVERARTLLDSKNPYLWSLACWRLLREPEHEDILRLAGQFNRALTPAQALYLDGLFDEVTDDAARLAFTPDTRHGLLRILLETYAMAKVGPQTAPAQDHAQEQKK